MEDKNVQNTNHDQPQSSADIDREKVVQPSESFTNELREQQPTTSQLPPQATPNNATVVDTTIGPSINQSTDARAKAVSSVYPNPISNPYAAQKNIPASDGQHTKVTTSMTILSQVPTLKTFLLLGVGLASLQLFVLLIYRGTFLNSLTILKFTTHGSITTVLNLMIYAAQISVIINLLIFLMLTLNKSFKATHRLLSLAIVFNVLSAIINLLSGNITGIIFTFIIVAYIRSVMSEVDLARDRQVS